MYGGDKEMILPVSMMKAERLVYFLQSINSHFSFF